MFADLNWGAWLYGLGSGFVGGGAGAVTSGVTVGIMDPTGKFAIGGADSIKLMAACFAVNGVLSMFFYLKQHPLPEKKAADVAVAK